MLFDTDILIWLERGNKRAANLFDREPEILISVQTYMEFLQCASSKIELQENKDFLAQYAVQILPLTEHIGHRASIYIEEYTLSSGLRAGDALVAATAVEHNLTLATSNRRHFKEIRELKLHLFAPSDS